MSENDKIIGEASPHTVKKFELIEKYVEAWAPKLLYNEYCQDLVFIDCMCNSGEYRDVNGKQVFGTPVRVTNILRKAAMQHTDKDIYVCFNDKSEAKIRHLEQLIGKSEKNFHITLGYIDGNEFLELLWERLSGRTKVHCLLVYDPFQATINWKAIEPFLNMWGEVIINHMVSDSMRGIKVTKSSEAIKKYEDTYQEPIEKLILYGSDKDAFENRIKELIALNADSSNKYHIATAEFFNTKNALVYCLLHFTKHLIGFNLFKECMWQAFGGKSSLKDTHGNENQWEFDFEGDDQTMITTDKSCYNVDNVAKYLQDRFAGRQRVPLEEVWGALDLHPVFPSIGFRDKIKKILKDDYNAQEFKGGKGRKGSMSFMKRRNP